MLLSFLMNINILVLTKVQYNPNTMLSQTFAQIRNLSNQLPDPIRADRAMHQLLCTNVKLTRKVLTKNLLKTVMKKNIATNDVMKYAKGVCKKNVKINIYPSSDSRQGMPCKFLIRTPVCHLSHRISCAKQ